MGPHPYTKSYRQLTTAERGRIRFSTGKSPLLDYLISNALPEKYIYKQEKMNSKVAFVHRENGEGIIKEKDTMNLSGSIKRGETMQLYFKQTNE